MCVCVCDLLPCSRILSLIVEPSVKFMLFKAIQKKKSLMQSDLLVQRCLTLITGTYILLKSTDKHGEKVPKSSKKVPLFKSVKITMHYLCSQTQRIQVAVPFHMHFDLWNTS